MHRIVEEAADAGAGNPGRRRFQIQHLTDQPRLPEQAAVGPVAFLLQRAGEVRDHAEAEGAFAGDGLKAAQLRRLPLQIARAEAEQRQRAIRHGLPREFRRARRPQARFGIRDRGSGHNARVEAPRPDGRTGTAPALAARERRSTEPGRIRQGSGQHPVERGKAQGLPGIHPHHAAPGTDHLGGRTGGAGQGRRLHPRPDRRDHAGRLGGHPERQIDRRPGIMVFTDPVGRAMPRSGGPLRQRRTGAEPAPV